MEDTNDIFYIGFDNLFNIDLSACIDNEVNLVGKKVLFTMKKDKHSADAKAAVTKDFTITSDNLDEENTKLLKILITAAESTGPEFCEDTYFWDCKIFNADNTGLVYVPRTEVCVQDDVTDRIPT